MSEALGLHGTGAGVLPFDSPSTRADTCARSGSLRAIRLGPFVRRPSRARVEDFRSEDGLVPSRVEWLAMSEALMSHGPSRMACHERGPRTAWDRRWCLALRLACIHALAQGHSPRPVRQGCLARLGRMACHERGPHDPRAESNGGSAWESNPLRTLILKDLRRFRILPILRFLCFAVVNPQIAPSENRA